MLVSGEAKSSIEVFLDADHTFEDYTKVSTPKIEKI